MTTLYEAVHGENARIVVRDDQADYRECWIANDSVVAMIILDPDECRKLAAAVYAPIANLLEQYTDREIAQMVEAASWQNRLEGER